jgi:hypothetical protein
MGSLLKGLLSLVVLVLVVGVLVLGYLGFVPGVASVFGADKPRDLGVKYAQTDVESVNAKAKAKLEALSVGLPPQQSLKIATGKVPAAASFKGTELTGLVASHESKWSYYPVSDCQIRVNPDGTAEASGILRVDRAYGYAAATGVPSWVVDEAINRLKITNVNPPFYVKGTGAITNDKVTMDIRQAEIGRFTIPADWIAGNKGQLTSFVEDRVRAAGISVKSASFDQGALKFDGTVPETVGFSAAK